ncbi:hypothetical protein [Enterococcus sp. HY326]|uniref:hypothetical protein n=1 Tax=Enterococcus sp. HY326 TaxID=2971265 RepID=UPI00223EC3CE|nr:hypothetical protein [Enterococcus sp. HY326]
MKNDENKSLEELAKDQQKQAELLQEEKTAAIDSTKSDETTAENDSPLDTEVVEEISEDEELISDENLAKLPTVSKKVYRLIYGAIAVMLLLLAFGIYRFYPFHNKIMGTWTASDNPTYQLDVKEEQTSFTIKNVQNTDYINMVFEGDLKATGTNRYRLENVSVYLDVDKEGLSEDELTTVKEQENLYTVVAEDDETLKLQYTDEALASAFTNDLERMFYFTLEDFKYQLFPQDLRVRSEALSQTSFILERQT